jgi:iron complex transport system ATP-binding protein
MSAVTAGDLEVRGLSAGYRGRAVLHDVSASVPAGGWLGVVGPNGAGKSTLLKAVAGVLPSSGEVRLSGVSLRALSPRDRARAVGYAPQSPALPDGLTVTDYVLLGRTPHLRPLARESRADLAVAAGVLDRLDLTALAGRRLAELSGGERQRVVLARVLAQQARLLLLDEPTTGLDVGHAQALLELVDDLRRTEGVTVVSTLHDLTLAAQYADRVLLVADGVAVAEGAPAEVLTADRIARHYQATVTLLHTPTGSPVITPTRPGDR